MEPYSANFGVLHLFILFFTGICAWTSKYHCTLMLATTPLELLKLPP